MNRDLWKRLEQVVDPVLEMDAADRAAFLERLAAQDPDLCRELEAFLATERAAQGFLDAPVDERAASLFVALGEDQDFQGTAQREGERIGPYRVLRELGRGGMGAVFLAERADGQFEQRVALKLVRQAMAGDEALARFRAERQILARLQHAHIARLLDGGVSASGQPWFAMELVEGVPLVRYCDETQLSVSARIRLFLQICGAVDYAHRNLVVHRDLKPSNVLVTPAGQAMLLDFGIAKVLEPADDDGNPTLTLLEARAMTPQYAAPEQLVGEPVTTATDVYSLGVVLYELLSGRHPYTLYGLTPGEVERVVVQREPEPPSSAVSRAAAEPSAETIAQARGVGTERLVRALRGDLDTVVRMALRKEPHRRYPSVRALSGDLQRVLDGLPVSARPDTFGYRASKFVRRHRFAVAGAALLAASLLAGVLGTVWQAREAVRQARKAEEVKRFAFSLFEVSDPDVAKGKEITARQLLERAPQRIQSELSAQPDVEAEMLLFVGRIQHRLGMDRESQPLLENALRLRRRGGDEVLVAEAEVALAGARFKEGDLEGAERLYASALALRVGHLGEGHPDTAAVRGLLGRVRFERGDLPGAETLLRAAITSQRDHLSANDPELAANINALGRVRHTQGDYSGAERLYREALGMRRTLFGDEHTSVSEGMLNLAVVKSDQGDVRGAEAQYRRVLANDRRLFGATHEAIAVDLNNLGATLVVSDKCAEAKALLQESVDVNGRLYGADSPRLAPVLHNLSRALRCRGEWEQAESSSRRALALAVAMLGEHPNVDRVRAQLARILGDRGKLSDAKELARLVVANSRQRLPADHPWLADALLTLGQVLVSGGEAAEAERHFREAAALLEKRFGPGDWRAIEARVELAECLAKLGRPGAGADIAGSYPALVRALGPQHPLASRLRAAAGLSAVRRSGSG